MNTTTLTNMPRKVADFAFVLDKANIPYTLKQEPSDCIEHLTFWTFSSLEGRWFEAQMFTMFASTEKHTTSYGKRKNASTRYISTVITGVEHEPKNISDALISWSVWAVLEVAQ